MAARTFALIRVAAPAGGAVSDSGQGSRQRVTARTNPLEKAALDPARKTTNPTVKIATTLDPIVTATKRMGGRLGGSGKQGAAPDLARRRSDVDDR